MKWEKARKGRLLKWPISKPASEFISFTDCFHGRTMGALALTYKERNRWWWQIINNGPFLTRFSR